MADDSNKKKDVLELDLDELEEACEDIEYQDIVMQIRLMKSYGFRISWQRIGARMVAIYKKALMDEIGQAAVDDFLLGISGKTTN